MITLVAYALATAGFDPASAEAVYNGTETYTDDGTIRLWAEIARYRDPDTTLFGAVAYNGLTEWVDGFYTPHVATCFGTSTPESGSFLLHVGTSIALARGTPILFVPGAGDNASRGFITMATHMDIEGRPTFALTFPTPHGDVYQHAELLADAIAVVKARTGAEQVDLVAHSKGGIATAVYLSNLADTAWDGGAYESVGTRYRRDVRKVVLIATPLGGIDTSFRWPAGNLVALDGDEAFSPSSWNTWYPYTTANPWVTEDLTDQDLMPDGADYFPGHRQIQARQAYPLPGELPALGLYALQPDWYTTYEGGFGFQSNSDGIDAVVEAGGNLLDRLAAAGVDADVRLYLLAGQNPLMPNAAQSLWADWFGETWADYFDAHSGQWSAFVAELVGDSLISVGVTEDEVQGLASGALVLGEITGPSDGLVFVDSATRADVLTARGATVEESKVVNLSHLDLLYASPITGELLVEDAGSDPEKAWQIALGERYTEADTINWVEGVLEEDDAPVDTGEDTGDTGAPVDTDGTDDTGAPTDDPPTELDDSGKQWVGSCACSTGSTPPLAWLGLGLAALVLRRRATALDR